MKDRLDEAIGRLLAAWVAWIEGRARTVLVCAAAATLPLLAYTVCELGVNTDGRAMVAEHLPFRAAYDAFAEDFPILDNALLVVVDADSSRRARQAADRLAERLRASEHFRAAYAIGSGEFFERNALLYLDVDELEDLADRLALLQPLLAELARDPSLARFVDLVREGLERNPSGPAPSLDWAPVLDRLSYAAEAVLGEREAAVSWEDLLVPSAEKQGPARQVLVTEPVLDFNRLLPAGPPIAEIRRAARELGLEGSPGVRVRITGNPALNYEEMLGLAFDVGTAGVACFGLVALLLYFFLRRLRLVVAVLGTLLVGLVWTAAFATFAVGHLNIVSIAFAVLFIGLGVDFGIHLALRHLELLADGLDHVSALREAARSVGGSLLLCASTTAIGFFAFLPTDYIAVAELGLISGAGMFVSLFATLTVLPAWLTVAPVEVPGPRKRGRQGAPPPSWPARHARSIRWAAAALGVAAMAALPRTRFDPDVVRMRSPETESVQAFEDLLEGAETSPWNIDVVAPDPAAAERLAEALEPLPAVGATRTLGDLLPDDPEVKRDILADVSEFLGPGPTPLARPLRVGEVKAALRGLLDLLGSEAVIRASDERQRASLARARATLGRLLARLEAERAPEEDLLRFDAALLDSLRDLLGWLWTALEPGSTTVADLPPELVGQLRADDGRTRVQVFPAGTLDGEGLEAFVEEVERAVPGATGSAVSLVNYARTIVRALVEALASAALVIFVLLLFLWRRLSDTLLVMAPLALAAALTGAATVLLGIAFNFANVVVLPLLLGIGVDSGIHLVHRYRHEGTGGTDLLHTSTARGVVASSLTTLVSFGSLAFSDHRGMASLGMLLSVGVVLTMLANLLVLPALLEARTPRPALADAVRAS